jgi:heme/copper-type cytochrome/quinol oxidase subunit 3
MAQHQVEILRQKSYHKEIVVRFKNYNLMLYGFIFSIATLFFVCIASYVYVRWNLKGKDHLYISEAFIINTLVIFLSSACLKITLSYFRQHNYRWYKAMLMTTFVTGWIFMIVQFVGWFDTWQHDFTLQNVAAAFLYVISGLHAVFNVFFNTDIQEVVTLCIFRGLFYRSCCRASIEKFRYLLALSCWRLAYSFCCYCFDTIADSNRSLFCKSL